MIGKNIKALRKARDLTQLEFAKIVGVSRNSLSRYENGTSSVSTELIDRICQKFNVSYVDIVGREKRLTPVADYQLTLKIEIIKERGATILAQLYRYQDQQGITFDGENNPWVLMSDDLSDIINTKIYLADSFEEIERYNGYLDGIERLLELASQVTTIFFRLLSGVNYQAGFTLAKIASAMGVLSNVSLEADKALVKLVAQLVSVLKNYLGKIKS